LQYLSRSFRAIRDGAGKRKHTVYDFPTVDDGAPVWLLSNTRFASASSDRKWVKMLSTEKIQLQMKASRLVRVFGSI